jgi:subtilisin family serine protease
LLEELAADPAIEYIEPNYRLYPLGTPISGDNYAANQWGLKNYGQIINGYTGVAGIDINLETAWLITQGDPDVLVAVIDTGVDISHPDLVGSMWINANEIPANGVDDDENGFIDDYCGWDFNNKDNSVFDSATEDRHGTHCSGTIAATCNLVGITGVAPGVKILPLKFMNTGGGDTADAIAAIEYARTAGAKIVNCSWGGADDSIALRDAIASSDMLFIAAAGNEGKNIDDIPLYPASFDLPNIITVAAIDNQGKLASFQATVQVQILARNRWMWLLPAYTFTVRCLKTNMDI